MGVEVEGQREVADLVDGEEGPVADDEGLHLILEGDAAFELLGALRQVVELLELGAAVGFGKWHRELTLPPHPALSPGWGRGE